MLNFSGKKQFLAISLGLTLLVGLTLLLRSAIGASANDYKNPKITLMVATPFTQGHLLNNTAVKFKELIELESKQKIEVQIVDPTHKLSLEDIIDEKNVNLDCSSGKYDIQIAGGEPLMIYSPQYFFFNAPYVIKDYEHFLRVWNGPLGSNAKDKILQKGNQRSLGTVFRGYRQMTSNKAVNGPDDLVGLKLRLPPVQSWIDIWSSAGVTPISVPLPGLYNALSTGAAEASEGDLTQIQSYNLNQVQSKLSITNHLCGIGWTTINESTYQNLTGVERSMVVKNMNLACEWATQNTKDSDNAKLVDLQSKGMVVCYPDSEAIRTKVKPAVENLFKTEWPETTWDEVLAQ